MTTTENELTGRDDGPARRNAKKWSWSALDARSLFVLLYIVALFAMAVRPAVDPDMWWHLRTGELILEQGVPYQDVFSFTVTGQPWIAHEWLSQAIMWILYTAGGFPLLILAFAAIITATFFLIYTSSEGKPYLAVFLGLLAAFASAITWGARPQMFNMLFLALFVSILEAIRGGRFGVRAYIWFPILSVIWANLHSGYLAGVALLACYALGDGLQILVRNRLPSDGVALHARHVWAPGLAAVASLAAAALNPNTFALWLYPFETLSSPSMQQFILEWQPPEFRRPIFWPFAIMLLLGVVGWTYGKRPSVKDMLLFLGTAAAGLLSARNVPLFAVVAAPIISRAIVPWFERSPLRWITTSPVARKHPPRILLAINYLLLGLFIVAAAGWALQTIAGNEEEVREHYPVAAMDFIRAEGLDAERGFNDYNWGGYLIWHGIPVYVDGRADVYGDDFLFFYQQAGRAEHNWRDPLEQFNVAYVLIRREGVLATVLEEASGWREAYEDELARIFVRDGS